jgi:hypothetical protein
LGGRAAFGCLTAFALPFIFMGGLAIKQGLALVKTSPEGWILTAVGSVFAGVGVAVIAVAWYSMRSVSHDLAMKEQHPEQPWLWREDWSLNYAREATGAAAAIGLWVFAILWNLFCSPLLFILKRELANGNQKVLFALLFPAVGVLLLIGAIYSTFKRQRYGKMVCHFDQNPLPIGRTVRGDVELHANIEPASGFVIRLSCVHSVTTGSGKSSSTTETNEWDDEQIVSPSAAMRSPVGTRVPFSFVTPPDAPSTDSRNTRDRVFWRLSIQAEVPGVDLDTNFHLPLFAVPGITDVEASEFKTYAESHRVLAADRPIDPAARIGIEALPEGGEQLTIHSHPTIGGFIGSVFFLTIWTAAIVAMVYFKAPIGFPIVFGLFDLLILYSLFDYLFGRSIVRAGREGLRHRRTILGGGSMQNVPAADIASVAASVDNQKNISVAVKLKDGRSRDLARFVRSRTDAESIAARLERALGR